MNVRAMVHPTPAFVNEMSRSRRHDARAMTWSFVIHAALLVWMLLSRTLAPEAPQLVEITWMEAEVAAPVAATPPPMPQKVEPQKPQLVTPPEASAEKFERHQEVAEIEPAPQRPDVLQDNLTNKLDALQNKLKTSRPTLAVNAPDTPIRQPSMANVETPSPTRSGLVRSDVTTKTTAPAELQRSATPNSRPSLAVAPKHDVAQHAPAVATPDENAARKTMDGAQLVGPVADRPVVSHVLPIYPDWAKEEAIEGSVTLYFIVLADGSVKGNILVQKTSGHDEFDTNAKNALRNWRFAPLQGAGEQWGTITFNFRLRDH